MRGIDSTSTSRILLTSTLVTPAPPPPPYLSSASRLLLSIMAVLSEFGREIAMYTMTASAAASSVICVTMKGQRSGVGL